MAVYVDAIRFRRGREIRCHMVADSDRELRQMAHQIGLRPSDHREAGTPQSRYEISMTKRKQAVANGAIAISTPDLAQLLTARHAIHP